MYIIRNALANLKRNYGRNLLVGIILLFIISCSAIACILNETSKQMILQHKERFGAEVSIHSIDPSKKSPLSLEQLNAFSTSEYVKKMDLSAKTGYIPKDLQAIDDTGEKDELKGYLIGSSREDISDEFQKGTRKLIIGAYQENACIISKAFAEINKLTIGDSLTLQGNQTDMEVTLLISGIYDDVSLQANANVYGIAITNRNNEIYTSLDTVMKTAFFQSYGSLDIKMYLKNPEMLEDFKKELLAKGLPDSYEVVLNAEKYTRMIAPVEKIADISQTMMIGILMLGSSLLILISFLIMRERTHEIGILRAIGMKKSHIICGFLCEIFLITGICLVIGQSIAQLAAQPIIDALLLAQTSYEEAMTSIPLTELKASLDGVTMLKISLLAIDLASITSICGILFTVRYEPSTILRKPT